MANRNVDFYNYQYGTEVRKQVMPQTYPAPKQEPLKRPRPESRPKTDFLFGGMIAFCSVIVFLATISFVHTSSLLSSKQNELQQITNQLRKAQSDKSHLETVIASKLNLEYVQQVAQVELGMSEPLAHQIVYLSLPKESRTVYPEQ